MKQNTKNNLASIALGASSGAALAALAVICTVTGASFGAFFVAPFAVFVMGTSATIAIFLGKPYEFKSLTAAVSGLATLAAGIGLFFGVNKPSIASSSTPDSAPTENTKGVSFLNHENTFNAPAQNGKKTLALTARDFSSAPVAAQKALAA